MQLNSFIIPFFNTRVKLLAILDAPSLKVIIAMLKLDFNVIVVLLSSLLYASEVNRFSNSFNY
ncbi:hypothetical protein [Fusobacterium ulcerans]|uniref:hypothetical protein n=1 Tax=Fusobacterium ulcerans TaxID=861 RepID=UPI0030992951